MIAMINYNLLFIENKRIIEYLNLSSDQFLDILWEWCYLDNLWDDIEYHNLLEDLEELDLYLINTFIPEDLFHNYIDDEVSCYAFTVSDEKLDVQRFDNDNLLLDFIHHKIKEHFK